jgi:hypothetical protein
MAKFLVVKQTPENPGKGELVLKQSDFMEQIAANSAKAPKNKRTAVNHLREILQSISVKYDSSLNPMRVRLVNYTGLPFKDDTELSAIVTKILRNEHPTIFQRVLEYELAHRPTHTKLVYYVGDSVDCAPFFKAGLDSIDEKDVESYLTGKSKKALGRSTVTDEEVRERGD